MKVYDAIARALDAEPDANPADAAAKVLTGCTKADLLPLLVAEIAAAQRARVRTQETAAFIGPRPAPVGRAVRVSGAQRIPNAVALRTLLDEHIALGDGSRVRWGEATVDQLRQRDAMLAAMERGLAETRARIRMAIEAIERAGASCLDDVFREAAA